MSDLNELDALKEALAPGPDALAEVRQRARVLAAFEARRRSTWRPWALAAATGLVAIAIAAAVALRPSRPAVTFVDAQPVPLGAPLVVPEASTPLVLAFADSSQVTIAPGSVAQVDAADATRVDVRVTQGRVEAHVQKGTGRTWRYLAGEYAVRVTGTRLAVEWRPAARGLEVVVSEGAVEVTGPGLSAPVPVRAGQRWRSVGPAVDPPAQGREPESSAPPSIEKARGSAAEEPEPTDPLSAGLDLREGTRGAVDTPDLRDDSGTPAIGGHLDRSTSADPSGLSSSKPSTGSDGTLRRAQGERLPDPGDLRHQGGRHSDRSTSADPSGLSSSTGSDGALRRAQRSGENSDQEPVSPSGVEDPPRKRSDSVEPPALDSARAERSRSFDRSSQGERLPERSQHLPENVSDSRGAPGSDDGAWRSLLSSGRAADGLAAAKASGVLAHLDTLSDADALIVADAARLTHDAELARRALATVANRAGPLSAEGAFLLGRLEADQHHPDAAASAFRRCVERAPKGEWAEEARGRLLETLLALPDEQAASAAAIDYLVHHPDGAWSRTARLTLDARGRRTP